MHVPGANQRPAAARCLTYERSFNVHPTVTGTFQDFAAYGVPNKELKTSGRTLRHLSSILVFAITHATGLKLAEAGFLLILIAGVWLVAAEVPALGLHRARTIVAGAALAVAGVLLIVATHWGHVG
jgi:hypothetical protein